MHVYLISRESKIFSNHRIDSFSKEELDELVYNTNDDFFRLSLKEFQHDFNDDKDLQDHYYIAIK